MVANQVTHKVNLIDGAFTPEEAQEVLNTLIQEKIKFHKIKRFQKWVADCNCDSSELTRRVDQLQQEKMDAKAFFEQAGRDGAKLVIKGTVEISYVEE